MFTHVGYSQYFFWNEAGTLYSFVRRRRAILLAWPGLGRPEALFQALMVSHVREGQASPLISPIVNPRDARGISTGWMGWEAEASKRQGEGPAGRVRENEPGREHPPTK